MHDHCIIRGRSQISEENMLQRSLFSNNTNPSQFPLRHLHACHTDGIDIDRLSSVCSWGCHGGSHRGMPDTTCSKAGHAQSCGKLPRMPVGGVGLHQKFMISRDFGAKAAKLTRKQLYKGLQQSTHCVTSTSDTGCRKKASLTKFLKQMQPEQGLVLQL